MDKMYNTCIYWALRWWSVASIFDLILALV